MSKYNFKFSMNRNLAGACHLTLWAYMFLSPLTYWRGTNMNWIHYLMTCMQPLLLMIVFYANYLYLAPKFFVAGKHRYDLMINVVMLTSLGIFLHYWMAWVNDLFVPQVSWRSDDTIGTVAYILRDSLNLAVFAAGATALALARRWVTADQSLKESEAARAQAELANLRNPINPHFLLNTLNNIYALTAFDTRRAQEAIQQLSGMLRHILYDNQEKEVEMKDEVNFLQNYVNLMKIRLPGTVDVTFDTQHVYPRAKIVPLILIPLIENAFKHGVSPTQPSFIHITLKADESCIDFLIENSNHPKLANDQSGHGIGLELVQRRLDLAYPGHYQWDHGPRKDGTVYYSHIIIE